MYGCQKPAAKDAIIGEAKIKQTEKLINELKMSDSVRLL